ncbi:MAG: methyltransferase domain-containing protein [Brachybacterium sp.]|uniref:methyltransferase domain-containing protein n=1 Tax=Brachybacterium sp. TaxID=1891286 RepID=UPI00264928D8|nr:methyltransferase domain-containing protein [Brachybacterium sp.]MDN5685404.1 methyltransferase domain-containing protein [Brachybacterium sp.]
MVHAWGPEQYLKFGDERGRPFTDLLARVDAEAPELVVDLGAGPGTLTAALTARWPSARVIAVDSSPEMIARAESNAGIHAELGNLRTWEPPAPIDVLVSNAALQWVPDHLEQLPRLAGLLSPGGVLAMQVPGNFAEPSHTIRHDLAAEHPYAEHLVGVAHPASYDASTYVRALQQLGLEVDAWETTYLHVLHGRDPVFEWVSGTGARPTLQALPASLRPAFEAEFRARLRAAYPDDGRGVLMPFRRVFAVAHRSTRA